MFFRTKNISGKEYAYRVKNKWTPSGPRQRVAGYIGRVHRLDKKIGIEFNEFVEGQLGLNFDSYLENIEFNNAIKDIVKWELYKHGGKVLPAKTSENFDSKQVNTDNKENDEKSSVKEKIQIGTVVFEINDKSVLHKGKEVALKINEGYLCGYTLKRIFNAGLEEDEGEEPGFDFAHLLISAGLDVPKEIFVRLYEKLS